MQVKSLQAFSFFVSLLLISFNIQNVNADSRKDIVGNYRRPKIGLVLSGGGALGFAHIGVLRILEKEKIPVDMIAGTSMGAIVGAAYAAGRTPDELESILGELDWAALFNESIPRDLIPYRLKPGVNREVLGTARIGLSENASTVPLSIIEGQKVLPVLQKLYNKYRLPTDFDKLPIPFRAIAADIETGKPVEISSGDLAFAARASMAVPGVFSPMEMEGKMLVDGGIANNLPISVVKEMGADIVIAVDLPADFKKAKDLTSLLSISGQILSLLLEQNSTIQRGFLSPKDILIQVDLNGFSASDFMSGKEIMERGLKAAQNNIEKLKKHSISPSIYDELIHKRTPIIEDKVGIVSSVKFDNHSNFSQEYLENIVKTKSGDLFDRSVIENDIASLHHLGAFSRASYTTQRKDDGTQEVTYSVSEKSWFPEYVRFGMNLEDDFSGDSFYTLAGNYHINHLNDADASLDITAQIGRSNGIETYLRQPFWNGSSLFVMPELTIMRRNLNLSDNQNETIARYLRGREEIGVRLGVDPTTSSEASIGYLIGSGQVERKIGSPLLPEADFDIGEMVSRVGYDSLDDADFATKGFLAKIENRIARDGLGSNKNFEYLHGQTRLPFNDGRNHFQITSEHFYSPGSLPIERAYSLGGFLDVSGLRSSSLLATDYNLLRVIPYRKILESGSGPLGMGVYLGGSVELGRYQMDNSQLDDPGLLWSGSTFIGFDTPLLPAYIGIGFTEGGEQSVYFNIGRAPTSPRY
jgi:NTE family protein